MRPPATACAACRHFGSEPLSMERADPGLAVLSSGFAALRAGDGVCALHRRYVAPRSSCVRFQARAGTPTAL